MPRYKIKPEHRQSGRKVGPEGKLVLHQIMVPKSLKAWLLKKKPDAIREVLTQARDNDVNLNITEEQACDYLLS